jgi:hypothetical protein
MGLLKKLASEREHQESLLPTSVLLKPNTCVITALEAYTAHLQKPHHS